MVTFQGLNSVIDRTLFTNRGPIVKRPLDLLTGSNLQIVSETDVEIPTASFVAADLGKTLEVAGSPAGRNDVNSAIAEIVTPTRVRLENVSFDVSDVALTTADVVGVANDLKAKYEAHRTETVEVDEVDEGVHATHDSVNSVVAGDAFDLPTAVVLLNDIKVKYGAHAVLVSGAPPTHTEADDDRVPVAPDATQLASAVQLANDLLRKFDAHRQDRFLHQNQDSVNVPEFDPIRVTVNVFPGALTGPFPWILRDPRLGTVADDPTDVEVRVNGSPVAVETVYGLLGAVVLQAKPGGPDAVVVDYDHLNNPPSRLLRLNSPEFNTNQVGNRGFAGMPKHRYRSRSYIIDPGNSPDLVSATEPLRRGWKYKALERSYSAVLNDPTTLLTNVPSNRIAYPVLFDQVAEVTIRYDPVTLPQDAIDPWTFEGEGTLSLAVGGGELTVIDSNVQTGTGSLPPFFSHALDLRGSSFISSAFRLRVLDDVASLVLDGDFTGVVFGVSDGQRTALVGYLITDATSLSSAIAMVNEVREKFDLHLTNLGSHNPDDEAELVGVVAAFDLTSLVILSNELKARFNAHIAKGSGVGSVHQTVDGTNAVTPPDASDLDTAIALVNELRARHNAHLTQLSVHFVDDVANDSGQVKQVGIHTRRGPMEFQESWDLFYTDWTEFQTYRLFLDSEGTASLFLRGQVEASVVTAGPDLPPIASIDGKFDPVQQTFFGSIVRDATSESRWQFIRVNVQPTDGNLIEDNKSVDYDASVLPELDASAPWITVGQGGDERILTGDILQVDSTASVFGDEANPLGEASGGFRGFIRLEPILTGTTAASMEFRASVDYWTHSLDNQAASFVIDDDNFTVQFAFLQFTPSAATVVGTVVEPFSIINGDQLLVRIGDGLTQTVTFPGTTTTAAAVAAAMNAELGFTFAADGGGRIRLTSADAGVAASFEIVSGNALTKLGFSVGPYFGLDSNPEPKLSWFGEDLPDLDEPVWARTGTQASTMLGRTMRLTDLATTDYVSFSLGDPIVTNQVFGPDVDWKLNARLTVRTFVAGDAIPAGAPYIPLNFAGALLVVDEGTAGKNLELHLSVDGVDQYLNLLSFNQATGELDVVSQYAFSWNDGASHTFNVYTDKTVSDGISVLADGVFLPPASGPAPTYSSLNAGVTPGPSVSFGSGSEPVVGSDLKSSQSVVDWESVAIFRDAKIRDPEAASRRFIGIYVGGDPALFSSYVLHQVDWSVPHVYRIVRNPVTSVSVFVDGAATPSIAVPYDVLSLPPVSSSFLSQVSSGRPTVAFGGFSDLAISRTRWEFIRYSIGKITLTDRLIPPHQVQNQGNAVTSPDHLFTNEPHKHQGFKIYSGGTVIDDFMANEDVASYTELGADTPPVPMTQDLESRGGFVRVGTPQDGIASVDLVNTKGFMADLEDDTVNVLGVTSSASQVILLANDLRTQYEAHRLDDTVHGVADVTNPIVAPVATTLSTAITLLNDIKAKLVPHQALLAGVHFNADVTNVVTAADATDLVTAVTLANDLRTQYEAHRTDNGGIYHPITDRDHVITAPVVDDATANGIARANDWREKYLLHVVQYRVHLADDGENVVLPSGATDLSTAIVLANAEKDQFNKHRTAIVREIQRVHSVDDMSNPVLSSDATDVESLAVLLDELAARYGSHRVEPAVHGSSMFIRIDPPSRVLYEGMKFWTFDEGDAARSVYPFSDDETLHMDGIRYQTTRGLRYDGNVLPEDADEEAVRLLANDLKGRYNAHRTEAGVHPTDDTVNVVTAADATDLATSMSLLIEIKADMNAHLGEAGVHVADDPRNAAFSADPTAVSMAIALANELRLKFGRHRVDTAAHSSADDVNVVLTSDAPPVADPGWRRFDEGAGTALTSLIMSGPTKAFRHRTGSGPMTSVYRKDTGVPDAESLRFEFTVRMRVNSFTYSPDVDTSIYAGFLSSIGPGVAAGIGFEGLSNVPHVKIQDVNADVPVYRVPFNWADGAFHTYRIVRDPVAGTFSLVILS